MNDLYTILTVSNSLETEESIVKICSELEMKNITASDKFDTLDFLMDQKVNAIVVHTEVGESEIVELLEIISQDFENQKTPVIIISELENNEDLAYGTSHSNVISIFTHKHWQFQLNNLLSFLKSQTINTSFLKSELVKSEERNVIDPLTGALNRYGAEDTFRKLTSRYKAYNERFSIIMLDIDHFKLVNDTYGHDAGDEVLISISCIIKNSIRNDDSFIRLGGEEFVVFLSHADLTIACTKAEQFREKIETKIHSSKNLKITSSFGVVEYQENEDLETLIKRSDELLYFAKDNGRNMVVSSIN